MSKATQRNLVQVAETHRANIQKRLQHRLEVAKASGDQNLVRVLEDELKQM